MFTLSFGGLRPTLPRRQIRPTVLPSFHNSTAPPSSVCQNSRNKAAPISSVPAKPDPKYRLQTTRRSSSPSESYSCCEYHPAGSCRKSPNPPTCPVQSNQVPPDAQ